MKISADGGTAVVLSSPGFSFPQERARITGSPVILPNGAATVLVRACHSASGRFDVASIGDLSLSTGERKVVAQGSNARYVSTGHLVYGRGRTLYAVPFDLDRLEVKGEGFPVQVEGFGGWSISTSLPYPKRARSFTNRAVPPTGAWSSSTSKDERSR